MIAKVLIMNSGDGCFHSLSCDLSHGRCGDTPHLQCGGFGLIHKATMSIKNFRKAVATCIVMLLFTFMWLPAAVVAAPVGPAMMPKRLLDVTNRAVVGVVVFNILAYPTEPLSLVVGPLATSSRHAVLTGRFWGLTIGFAAAVSTYYIFKYFTNIITTNKR